MKQIDGIVMTLASYIRLIRFLIEEALIIMGIMQECSTLT